MGRQAPTHRFPIYQLQARKQWQGSQHTTLRSWDQNCLSYIQREEKREYQREVVWPDKNAISPGSTIQEHQLSYSSPHLTQKTNEQRYLSLSLSLPTCRNWLLLWTEREVVYGFVAVFRFYESWLHWKIVHTRNSAFFASSLCSSFLAPSLPLFPSFLLFLFCFYLPFLSFFPFSLFPLSSLVQFPLPLSWFVLLVVLIVFSFFGVFLFVFTNKQKKCPRPPKHPINQKQNKRQNKRKITSSAKEKEKKRKKKNAE